MDVKNLILKAKKYMKVDEPLLNKAFEFAQKAHSTQTRLSGEPFLTHPLMVAEILTEYKADQESLIAALLHDIIEDTTHTAQEIRKLFGLSVSKMVQALTKLPSVNLVSPAPTVQFDSKIESIRKIFEVMQDDVRVIVIKLCDRLHNMRTLSHFRIEKQKRIAQETLDIYVKIADRLSFSEMKESLAELSYKYLYPSKYSSYQDLLTKSDKTSYKKTKKTITERIAKRPYLREADNVIFRHVPTYDEMLSSQSDELETSIEVIIIVSDDKLCYLSIRDIHSLWKSIRSSLLDYIAVPKSNGYQALETSIITKDNTIVKFVIQTQEMYDYSRLGIVSQCFKSDYKSKKIRLSWVQNLKRIHMGTKSKSEDYMIALQNDILRGSIVIYTGHDKTILLPIRSTALDAVFYHLGRNAFRINEIFVNGKKTHFSSELHDSDTIYFRLSGSESFHYDWIYKINSGYARSFIHEKIASFPTRKKVAIGREMLQEEFCQFKRGYLEEVSSQIKSKVAISLGLLTWNAVLQNLAEGSVSIETIIALMYRVDKLDLAYNQYLLIMSREAGTFLSITPVFDSLQNHDMTLKHLSTKSTKKGYIDRFILRCSSRSMHSFLQKLKPFYRSIKVRDYSPTRKFYMLLFLSLVVTVWTISPFTIRYLLSTDLRAISIATILLLTAGSVLLIISLYRSVVFGEDLKPIRFNRLFWIITFFLSTEIVLVHYSLIYIPSSHYITMMEIGLFFFFLISSILRYGRKVIVAVWYLSISTLLSTAALVLFLFKSYGTPFFIGHLIVIAVVISFSLYNSLNEKYQKQEKVQNRALRQLAYNFLFGGLFLIPFLTFDDLISGGFMPISVAILNGVFAGAIGHFLYSILSKHLEQYKFILALVFITPLVFFVDVFAYGLEINIYSFALLLVFISLLFGVLSSRRLATLEQY